MTEIYWLITIPKIAVSVGSVLWIIGLIAFLIMLLSLSDSYDLEFDAKKRTKYFVMSLMMMLIGILMIVMVPSTKELIAIYGINYVTNDENAQEIPSKLLEYTNVTLDELLESK